MPSLCSNPECNNEANLRCSWCKISYYCNKKCQKRDWPQHKQSCKWSLNRRNARIEKEKENERNKPHFIEISPGIWRHPARPKRTVIERYREIAAFPIDSDTEQYETEIFYQSNVSRLRNLHTFKRELPLFIDNKRISREVISFKSGPSKTIDRKSLKIIIKKSVKHWIDISDFILSEICSYHYNYKPFNAAYLIIALLSQNNDGIDNHLLSEYLRDAKRSSYNEDIDFSRSEELFESQQRLNEENMRKCIDASIFDKREELFVELINYMNGKYYDCHLMTNHITDDNSFYQDLYVFIIGVTRKGGLKGILMKIHDPEGDVW